MRNIFKEDEELSDRPKKEEWEDRGNCFRCHVELPRRLLKKKSLRQVERATAHGDTIYLCSDCYRSEMNG